MKLRNAVGLGHLSGYLGLLLEGLSTPEEKKKHFNGERIQF